jgi:hypothetical protein
MFVNLVIVSAAGSPIKVGGNASSSGVLYPSPAHRCEQPTCSVPRTRPEVFDSGLIDHIKLRFQGLKTEFDDPCNLFGETRCIGTNISMFAGVPFIKRMDAT